ncbi:FAD-dependent oxidoreductase [Nocardioides sp.]|uniref:oxidoreductase n=1 Tax=Nocardioides sp. TaxID=35761 RepID=UPI003D14EBDF
MTDSSSTPAALTPLRVGSIELRNRIAMSATVNNLGLNREITDAQIAFYTERAAGGVGAIVTEGMSVHPTSIPNPTVPLAYDEDLVPGLRRLADSVHAEGAALIGQLWHVGRQALWNPGLIPWGVSGQRDHYSGSTPHVMTEAEIIEVIEGFVQGARNLRSAGFDGAELHGAHGYLINQFLSPSSNRRDDRWGGSLENRARFAVELINRVRAAAGDDFVVGIKLSVDEYIEGGLDLEATQAIVEHLAQAARPDYIATGQGNFSPSLEKHVPDLHFKDLEFAHLPRGVREVSDGIPVMAVSKVPGIDAASTLVGDGSADLVGMVRALLADAHLVRKAIEGTPARPCIYCNVCWDYIHTGRAVACVYAPDSERPTDPEPATAGAPLTVDVVGGGPAGLEFARVALQRGKQVHVHEASGAVGGRMRREAQVEGREVYQQAVDWLEGEVRRLGGEISLNDPVDLGETGKLAGDLTVVATGAVPILTELPGVSDVRSLEDVLADPDAVRGPVVIVDEVEAEPVYGIAEELARRGLEVTILTRRAALGRRVPYINLIGVHRRLDEAGIDVHVLTVPQRAEDGQLVVSHAFSGRERVLGPIGTLVEAGPYRSSVEDLAAAGLVVGDASAPRDLLAAVREANTHANSAILDAAPGKDADRAL